MLRNKKIIASVFAAVALALMPLMSSQAAIGPHDVTYGGINFISSANGGTGNPDGTGKSASGCNGTIIGVYGSSALKSYINQAAKDYCNSPSNPNHYDVEYAGGGDSCPGDAFAANDSTDPVVGVSDVFVDSCAVEGFAVASAVNDALLSVNVVDDIATCPGATEPNGGAVNPAGTTPCGPFATDPASTNAASCSPSGLSLQQANLLYNQGIGNESGVGGCNHVNAVQNRASGSGTRVTFCFNVYGPGNDLCNNLNAPQGSAGTTGTEVKDVCGNAGTGAAPVDGNYAQGYVTRSAIVGDPNSTTSPKKALSGCGVVSIGGYSGYNGACNPATASTTGGVAAPDGVINCPGDIDVATGRYQVWGYEHLVTNPSNNALAQGFVNYVIGTPSEDVALTQAQGFLRKCQMGFVRGSDAAPYSLTTATC